MSTLIERQAIYKHLLDYAKLISAEADKLDVVGVQTTPSLYDKADEIMYLADLLLNEKVQIA